MTTDFTPTYLYIKQHAITGKCYFGKTTRADPVKYLGSGKHWKAHIKIHGKEHVETLWHKLFTDQAECTRIALLFSEQQDIVKSDRWLNLMPENGLDGGEGASGELLRKMQLAAYSSPNHNSNLEHMKKWHDAGIASPNHPSKNPEHVRKMQAFAYISPNHNSKDPLHVQKLLAASRASPNHNSKCKSICPHCKKTGKFLSMKRWHFDNCKKRVIA